MKAFLFPLILLLGGTSLQGQFQSSTSRSFDEYRAARLDFSDVDLNALVSELAKRNGEMRDEAELKRLVTTNLQFIYFNKLNKRSFLVVPQPQKVVDRITDVFGLMNELEEEITRGRSLVSGSGTLRERREVVEKVGSLARELRRRFREYFIELEGAHYRIVLPPEDAGSNEFLHYLVQSSRITRILERQMVEYFLSSAPGRVSVDHLEEANINVLSESLQLLSELTRKRLRD